METIQGTVVDITFRNEENGFTVLRLSTSDAAPPMVCLGPMLTVEPGETLKVTGEFQTHARFGRQFSVSSFESVRPVTIKGIAALLGSGLIENIGEVRAKKIIDVFGLETLNIMDNQPSRLLEVPGIGKKTLEKIIAAWQGRKNIRELMSFLQDCDITVNMASKIYATYGEEAKTRISQNPYCLIDDIWGVGFKKADAIAQKLGFTHDSFKRIRAGLTFVMSQAASDGHTYLPDTALKSQAAAILEVPEEKTLFSLDHMIQEKALVSEERRVYLPHLYQAECAVAGLLAGLWPKGAGSLPNTTLHAYLNGSNCILRRTTGAPTQSKSRPCRRRLRAARACSRAGREPAKPQPSRLSCRFFGSTIYPWRWPRLPAGRRSAWEVLPDCAPAPFTGCSNTGPAAAVTVLQRTRPTRSRRTW